MAGLKIVLKDTAGFATDDISVDGYVEVTDNFILNPIGYGLFEGAGNPGARADRLQAAVAGAPTSSVVTTLNKDTPIDSVNCRISARKDDNHVPGTAPVPAFITVPMPPAALTSLGYLDEYILALNALVSAGDLSKARRFLYGVMMLTRCR